MSYVYVINASAILASDRAESNVKRGIRFRERKGGASLSAVEEGAPRRAAGRQLLPIQPAKQYQKRKVSPGPLVETAAYLAGERVAAPVSVFLERRKPKR